MNYSVPRRSEKRQSIVLAMLFVAHITASPTLARGETWAERLGFPADKKVVILHAHEMGMCLAANEAAHQLHASGLPFSTSAMAPCAWFSDYAETVSKLPQADVGLELTLNSEWPNYRWQPMATDESVHSLIDDRGYFWSTSVQTMVNGNPKEVEHELFVQLVRAQLEGVEPTHLTTHLGTLFTRIDFAQAYLKMAREHWIPAVVVELTPERVLEFKRLGFPVSPELVQLLEDYPLPKVDHLVFLRKSQSYESKKQEFKELIEGLEPGLTQVAFHPAVESEELKRIADDWQERVWDAQLFQDPEVQSLLESDEIILTTWREVMDRFEGTGSIAREVEAARETP